MEAIVVDVDNEYNMATIQSMYPFDNRSKRAGGGVWLTELSQDELRTIAYEMPVEEVENNSEETTQEEPTT